MIYESIAKTDNQALDLVLTEKSLLCEKYHIQFSYIADGKLLDFMSLVDIYSLFGNALDNAIEALLKEEEDKRVIQMNIRARGKLLYIDIDNYSSRKIEFQDGLPVTDKADKDYHGFGLKSIRYITEKYDGAFSVAQKNDMFLLHLLFSRPSA
jgi:sensor histidine kinase regulating citrate/malate metabolism